MYRTCSRPVRCRRANARRPAYRRDAPCTSSNSTMSGSLSEVRRRGAHRGVAVSGPGRAGSPGDPARAAGVAFRACGSSKSVRNRCAARSSTCVDTSANASTSCTTIARSVPSGGRQLVWTLHGNLSGGQRIDDRTICVTRTTRGVTERTRSFATVSVSTSTSSAPRRATTPLPGPIAQRERVAGGDRGREAVSGASGTRGRMASSLSRYVRFVGEVGGTSKRELLAGARCLWMPVRWEDPCR